MMCSVRRFVDYVCPCRFPCLCRFLLSELVKKERYGKPVDMWAFGVILYILHCGYPPFYHDSNYLLGQKIMRGQFEFQPDYWKGVSEDVKDLISHLLDINPKTRYTVDQALNHPWFTSVENTDSQLESHHLGISQLRKFQARKKFRGAIKAIIMIERIKRLLSVKRSSKSFKDLDGVEQEENGKIEGNEIQTTATSLPSPPPTIAVGIDQNPEVLLPPPLSLK
jgi:serine/threonine protein kinase